MSGDEALILDPERIADRIRSDLLIEWMAWFKIDGERRRGQQLEEGARSQMETMKRQAPQHLRR